MSTDSSGRKASRSVGASRRVVASVDGREHAIGSKSLSGHAVIVTISIVACIMLTFVFAVLQNWHYSLSIVHPSSLEVVAVDRNTLRVFPHWDAAILDKKTIGGITKTLVGFHRACRNSVAESHWKIFYQKLDVSAGDQVDTAFYRPDRFDAFADRDSVLSRVAANSENFCSSEYWQAVHDARVLASIYVKASKQVVSTLKEPDEVVIPVVISRAETPSYNIPLQCSKKWPANYTMQEYCIKNANDAKDWWRGSRIDSEISQGCASKWGESWDMFKYCAENEQKAKNRIRG